jgi:hypothetical protein
MVNINIIRSYNLIFIYYAHLLPIATVWVISTCYNKKYIRIKISFMEKNVGGKDKMMRIIIGALGLVLGATVSSWFYIFAVIGFVTAFVHWCPINKMLGINTCAIKEEKKEETYVCEGTCGGVAHEPKNCGESTCTHYKAPLIKQ